MSVLVILAHPNHPPSRVNAALADAAARVPGVVVCDLYDTYPHFLVDVTREQARVAPYRTLVFQHPLFWYSVPPLLKQWYDTVLTRGWAYGHGADALAGKTWVHALSSAGSAHTYSGHARSEDDPSGRASYFPLDDYLKPFQQSARLCGMRWGTPFTVHAAERLDDAALADTCARYADWLRAHAAAPAGA